MPVVSPMGRKLDEGRKGRTEGEEGRKSQRRLSGADASWSRERKGTHLGQSRSNEHLWDLLRQLERWKERRLLPWRQKRELGRGFLRDEEERTRRGSQRQRRG